MKKRLYGFLASLAVVSLSVVACQQKDQGNKDQEISFARQSYDRCIQTRGQDSCNVIRANSVMSIREYFGNNSSYNYGWGGNFGVGMGVGMGFGTQYNAQQIDDYFNNYLRRASREEIMAMGNQYSSSWNNPGFFNGNPYNPYNNPSRCNAYGCW